MQTKIEEGEKQTSESTLGNTGHKVRQEGDIEELEQENIRPTAKVADQLRSIAELHSYITKSGKNGIAYKPTLKEKNEQQGEKIAEAKVENTK